MRRAAFFDRDGTINVDTGYLYQPEKLEFIPGIPKLIRQHNEAGDLVIVITNQSGIARGYYTVNDMRMLHKEICRRLQAEYRARIDAFYFCPHHPAITGECKCRKPGAELFLRAIKEHDIDPAISVSYGDSQRDEIASRLAGIREFHYIRYEKRHGE